MPRYIDADKLIRDCCDNCIRNGVVCYPTSDIRTSDICDFLAELQVEVLHAPTADVEPVRHGKWIYDSGDEFTERYHCSGCSKQIALNVEIYNEPKPNYCPNCGAKMDGERHG